MKKIIIGLVLAVIIVGALVWYAPTIISYFQNSSSSSSDASYTTMTLRDGMNSSASLEFGDTEYGFGYQASILGCGTIFNTTTYIPHKGDTYRDFGIEVKVDDIASDYLSNYIVISIKPLILNYAASLHYTRLNLTLNEAKYVNISSGIVNETHEYAFMYVIYSLPNSYIQTHTTGLRVYSEGKDKTYQIWNFTDRPFISDSTAEFHIETIFLRMKSEYLIFYVKPLY
jgi:hypothetical protein